MGLEEEINGTTLSFSVDAGIINRLGIELVGRSETAVSELIKNSYDADSTEVEVLFKNTNRPGGTLFIDDNGEGMDLNSLKDGFMRLSSTDKIHNPISKKFNRKKAGKKGIGRFSTQRLGNVLTIITKKIDMPMAIKIVIKWDLYEIDTELSNIQNEVTYVSPIKKSGTQLKIEGLRESWDNVEIRRVYRYISNLLQSDFLSDRTPSLNIAIDDNKDNYFKVYCKRQNEDDELPIEVSSPEKMLFSKAVATIEGNIDNEKNGFCKIISTKFDIKSDFIPVSGGMEKDSIEKFQNLKNIHFKAYYFIYNRRDYYDFDQNFTQLELSSIQKHAEESSGIKLYRNGFRVFPYGERGNDWLSVDGKLSHLRGSVNIPFENKNLFGFIEIIDDPNEGELLFEETASREGLIENSSFKEMQDFAYKTLQIGMLRIASAEEFIRAKRDRELRMKENLIFDRGERFYEIKKSISELQEKIKKDDPDKDEYLSNFLQKIPLQITATEQEFQDHIKENGMLRVLAGIGLVIGEFVHEIEQFDTIFKSKIKYLKKKIIDVLSLGKVKELEDGFLAYQSYTAYFRASVSQNVRREIEPINLKTTVNSFLKQIEKNTNNASIDIKKMYINQYLFTCPMHPSEWLSILFNLYTNSKKAIRRSKNNSGSILIKIEQIQNEIHLEFCDNGDGISSEIEEKIFSPFYTTSNPVNPEKLDIKDNSGTGLGLYIVKKIINSYNGTIMVSLPSEKGYNTCFKIILPANGK